MVSRLTRIPYFEELNSGESSATLWSTGPTWDFGSKVFGFSGIRLRRVLICYYFDYAVARI
jgi:hypothetical protein